MANKDSVRYQLKVIVSRVKPLIWRRIVVPGSLTLWELHLLLQVVMEWEEMHLHMFEIQNEAYGDPSNDEGGLRKTKDEHRYRLDRVIPRKMGFRFNYNYDFGDDWELALLVEKITTAEEEALPECLAGSRAGPLEDSGGPFGYMELIEALQDPDHPNHTDSIEWAGENYDPEWFDLHETNARLKRLVESGYQIEAMFAPDDEEDTEEIIHQTSVFRNWMQNLPNALQRDCETLALRKDVITLVTYLRDNKVKGTSSAGNLPLKAVRAIAGQFVHPPQLDFPDQPLRSEEDIDALFFVHSLAFDCGLVSGGPGERWEVTEDGNLFIALPPGAQVLQLFMNWMIRSQWITNTTIDVLDENASPQTRLAIIEVLAKHATGKWLPYQPFGQKISQAAGWHWPNARDDAHNQKMLLVGTFVLAIVPLQYFGVVDTRNRAVPADEAFYEPAEIRFTPLGKSLLAVVKDMVSV